MEPTRQILIVDDEKNIRRVLSVTLTGRGYHTQAVASAEEALRACEQTPFDLALLDIRLPGEMDGVALLGEIHARWPSILVIMLTAHASVASAITALRDGAFDYLVKPATMEEVVQSV